MSRMSYNKFIYNWVKAIRDYDKDENCQQYLKYEPKYKNLKVDKYKDLVFESVTSEWDWTIAETYQHEDFECDDWKPNCFTNQEPYIYLTSRNYLLDVTDYSLKEIRQILSVTEEVQDAVRDLYGELVENNSWIPFVDYNFQ